MKIDEASINHNVARLCDEASESCFDTKDMTQDNAWKALLESKMQEAYIAGVCDLARELKAVLRE